MKKKHGQKTNNTMWYVMIFDGLIHATFFSSEILEVYFKKI